MTIPMLTPYIVVVPDQQKSNVTGMNLQSAVPSTYFCLPFLSIMLKDENAIFGWLLPAVTGHSVSSLPNPEICCLE